MTDTVIVAATANRHRKVRRSACQDSRTRTGATVIRDLLARAGLQPDQISEVILGQVS